ncbi:MAG: FkbM family methyltransferase [Nitrospinota bacterium]|nr:FkbM family methyltransferase [Nitrospinota bacterium]
MSIVRQLRSAVKTQIVNTKILKRPIIRYCIDNHLLPNLLARTPSSVVREIFNLPYSEYETQLNQDIFALMMCRFRSGYFIEIGANDGFTLSNTVYLEEHFGWKGVLVEANPKNAKSLARRKNSVVVNKAVSSKEGSAEFIDAGLFGGLKESLDQTHRDKTKDAACITVECLSLQSIMEVCASPSRIDYVSIDVEGGELDIVEQMIKVNRRFSCGTIEHSWRMTEYHRMAELLASANYKVIWSGQTEQDIFFIDEQI